MKKATVQVINALRQTTSALEKTALYQWGHMGLCNCGFLAQHVTGLQKSEIHARAMVRHGDWSEQLNDYCPTSGLPMDELISQPISFGFDAEDLKHLERLADKHILEALPLTFRDLKYNIKTDVITDLNTWISLLEKQFTQENTFTEIESLKVLEPMVL